jgi:hypothetical protein
MFCVAKVSNLSKVVANRGFVEEERGLVRASNVRVDGLARDVRVAAIVCIASRNGADGVK